MIRLTLFLAVALALAGTPTLASEPKDVGAQQATAEAAPAPEPAPRRSTLERWRGGPQLRAATDEIEPSRLDRMIPVFLKPVGGAGAF